MMRYIYLIILGLFFSVINMEANNSASISLVPCPTNVVPGTGSFQFTPKTVFAVETEDPQVSFASLHSYYSIGSTIKKEIFDAKIGFFVDKNLWKMWITIFQEAFPQCLQRLRLP